MRATGRRAAGTKTRSMTACVRSLRRWLSRLDAAELHVRRHPSRHSVDVERWADAVRTARGAITPVEWEHDLDELLEEWGRTA